MREQASANMLAQPPFDIDDVLRQCATGAGEPPDHELRTAGVVTDICGHFLDADGRELDHPLNRRAITLSLDALRKIPTRVFAAGGLTKAG